MPTSWKHVINCVSLGEPPQKMGKDVETRDHFETVRLVTYNFKDFDFRDFRMQEYPLVNAHGLEWRICVFATKKNVSCWLILHGDDDVTATCTFRCKGTVQSTRRPLRIQGWWSNGNCTMWITGRFLKLDDVIANYLEEDGSLVIECDIRIAAGNKHVWYPKELQRQDVLVEIYENALSKTSDVVFSVGGTIFRVHKIVLSCRAKKLYEIANESENDDVPIPIHFVSGEIFKSILDFVYTVKTPVIEKEHIATELLAAADRYECIHLKLYVESIIVDKFLTAGNAAALLIFADSYSCALLKEAATNLFVTDAETVKNTDAWSKIKESNRLLTELLDIVTCSKKNMWVNDLMKMMDKNDTIGADKMDVTALREHLENAELELDGSREVLVNRMNKLTPLRLYHG